MNREQLEHVLPAAADITQETSFVVVGSQAVLLRHPDAPGDLLVSREIDLYPAMAPEKAALIEGAIGALSRFDDTFGYYADGVGPETATLPPDWMQRADLHYIGPLTVVCPELHDLAVSKCAAARRKDGDYVRALLRHGLIDGAELLRRIDLLAPSEDRAAIAAWSRRRIAEAQDSHP